MVDDQLKSREHILERMQAFPDDLHRVVFASDVPDEELARPGSDGGWGVIENLAHLRDWEEVFILRARRVINEDQPHILGMDDSLWPIERNYGDQNPAEVFAIFAALRRQHNELLEALPVESWERTGIHSLFGEVTLQWLENHVCEHDESHLMQIKAVLAG